MCRFFVSQFSIPTPWGSRVTESVVNHGMRSALQHRIGDVVRRGRKARNMSQEAFADHIEMHRAQYNFVERGVRDLRLSTLERVALGLEQSLSVILGEAEEASP